MPRELLHATLSIVSRTRLFPCIITSLGLYGSVVGSHYDFQGSEYLEPLL